MMTRTRVIKQRRNTVNDVKNISFFIVQELSYFLTYYSIFLLLLAFFCGFWSFISRVYEENITVSIKDFHVYWEKNDCHSFIVSVCAEVAENYDLVPQKEVLVVKGKH